MTGMRPGSTWEGDMLFRALSLFIPLLLAATLVAAPADRNPYAIKVASTTLDQTTYIDGNRLLMFVTNQGGFGRDPGDVFGYGYGTFFPYQTRNQIEQGILIASPLYAAGLWLGGLVGGEPRLALAEYGSEYVPGPMADSSYQSDRSEFRVYKLYRDSLENNPNSDYLNWPIDQGAPVDATGRPLMRGKQMTWSVFNDANPSAHTIDPGGTTPLGIEVRQTSWADSGGPAIGIVVTDEISVAQTGESHTSVKITILDPGALDGHAYEIRTDSNGVVGRFFDLFDVTLGTTVISQQPIPAFLEPPVIQGFSLSVADPASGFGSFELVQLGDSVFSPPRSAAVAAQGFPTPGDVDAGDDLWAGAPRWAIHTADNGGSSGGGTRSDFYAFLSRVTRDGANNQTIGQHDYEIRFTGEAAHPGIGGSYVIEWFNDDNVFWVPFELWRIGSGTPDDPSDDIRLVPFVIDDGDDNAFGLESYGSSVSGTCGGDCEHSVSSGDDDPFTDWIYWYLPLDTTPGQTGYQENEAMMLAGTFDGSKVWGEILARTVLVNIDAGVQPPFAAADVVPEQGSVFRIVTQKPQPADTFAFTASPDTLYAVDSDWESVSLYIQYDLYNRGENAIDSFFISFWADPDLGGANDDLVGCDTVSDAWYVYNSDNDDVAYGGQPPASGFRLLRGPLIPSAADTALFGGRPKIGYRNGSLYSFAKFITGLDPDSPFETLGFMRGLTKTQAPYDYLGTVTRFVHSGDPVAAVGDLDLAPADRRFLASCEPISFAPGDSQSVLIKLSVGPGSDRLNSISVLRDILDYNPWTPSAGEMVVSSDTVSYLSTNPVTIDIGSFADISFGDIEPAGLGLNDQLAPDSVTYISGHPQFGDAYRLWFTVSDILNYTGPTDSLAFFINGQTNNGRDLYALGNIALVPAPMGDVNGDGSLDIDDLLAVIDYKFLLGPEPAWPHAADAYCDGEGKLTITDLTVLVNYLYLDGAPPSVCDYWLEP